MSAGTRICRRRNPRRSANAEPNNTFTATTHKAACNNNSAMRTAGTEYWYSAVPAPVTSNRLAHPNVDLGSMDFPLTATVKLASAVDAT